MKKSAQLVNMEAILLALTIVRNQSFNLYSDSLCIVKLFPSIETALIASAQTIISRQLQQLQSLIQG